MALEDHPFFPHTPDRPVTPRPAATAGVGAGAAAGAVAQQGQRVDARRTNGTGSRLFLLQHTSPDGSPVSPSAAPPVGGTRPMTKPATSAFGHSSSVSALGHEASSAISLEGDAPSSSDDDDDDAIAYDSDDRMTAPSSAASSRRPSMTSGAERERPRAVVRQFNTSHHALWPKMKSFVRISQDLQEEAAPLHFEMRREAEVTQTFSRRSTSGPPSLLSRMHTELAGSSSDPFVDAGATASDSPTTQSDAAAAPHPQLRGPTTTSHLNKFSMARRSSFAIPSDTDDSDSMASPSMAVDKSKRKHSLLDDSFDSLASYKRRAVSPGMSSPIIAPASLSKRTNHKQMQDASDGIQGMML